MPNMSIDFGIRDAVGILHVEITILLRGEHFAKYYVL